jgi:peroxiredoxin
MTSNLPAALKYDRRRALRHFTAAAFVAVVGVLFVRQQLEAPLATPGVEVRLGPLDERTVETGQLAPDFVLEGRSLNGRAGEPVRLSDFRGEVVVLNFWASWCGPCRQEMPEFEAAYSAGPAGDLAILAVNALSLDSRRDAERFVEEFGVTFPVAFDETGAVAERYRVRGLPSTFFIDRAGIVRAATLGPVFGGLLEQGIAKAEAGGS